VPINVQVYFQISKIFLPTVLVQSPTVTFPVSIHIKKKKNSIFSDKKRERKKGQALNNNSTKTFPLSIKAQNQNGPRNKPIDGGLLSIQFFQGRLQ
jgi:hypothetical protein